MSNKHPKPIPLYDGIAVNSPETLEEVLRLMESLEDLNPRPLAGIRQFRVNVALHSEKKIEPRQGRRMIG